MQGIENLSSVKREALSKLANDVRKKQSEVTKTKDEVSQTPELTLLLECLCSQHAVVAIASGQALVQLVQDDILDFTFTLNSIISFGPSVKVPSGVCEAVGDLLCLQVLAMESMGQTYRCPYSIRSSPHPLTSLLINRPDAWHDITQQVYRIFNHHDKRVRGQAVPILRPFVAFLLLEPLQSDQYARAREEVKRMLVNVCLCGSDSTAKAVTDFALLVFDRMQVSRKESVINNSVFLENMAKVTHHRLEAMTAAVKSDEDPTELKRYWDGVACKWLTHCLEVCCLCSESNAPLSGLCEASQGLARRIVLSPSASDVIICLLSTVLSYRTVCNHTQVLDLATVVVEKLQTPNALSLALLVSPLLSILSMTSTLGHLQGQSRQVKAILQTARTLLECVEGKMNACQRVKHPNYNVPSYLSEAGHFSGIISFVLQDLIKNNTRNDEQSSNGSNKGSGTADAATKPNAGLGTWLSNVQRSLSVAGHCSPILTNLVVAVLMTSGDDVATTKAVLQVMVKIASLDPNQAPDFLAVLLHAIGKNPNPDVRLALLEGIPLTATHKYCVQAALKTIQALASVPSLHALSIRLMAILWQRHDRTFAHLLRMVSGTTVSAALHPGEVDEVMLAKAAAIRTMCELRPQQHGAELLQPLSDILTAATGEGNTTASAIVLDGLYLLCQAEVIDIRSLWSVLGEKLMHETRSLVVTKICQLLSMVPILKVETDEYEAFLHETVTNLWLYTLSSDSNVKAAAYRALAAFPQELFKVSHFPRDITEEFYERTEQENANQEPEASEVTVDELFPIVPGYVFLSLLQTFDKDPEPLQAYGKFLSTMAKTEVSNLPRGVFYSALRRQGPSGKEGKALKSIPALLLKQWDQCQHPGLRPGLAAGLLFSYDPQLEVARDGRPRKHYVIRHGKAYLQMFNTLLQEVPIQPSDWHLLSLIPQAWMSFIERLFVALLECRKAELDLQEQHSHATASELEEKKSLAWLWVRDTTFDAIKSASKGSPSTQGHCVLALSCLARCIHRFAADLDTSELKTANESDDHQGHGQWMMVTIDTIRALIDPKYKAKESLHELWQQGSRSNRAPASTICVGMARVAASLMVPIFTQIDTDCILELLQRFARNLPQGPEPLTSPVVTFLNSLALGNMLGRLFEEHFSDMTGSKGMLAVWRALSALEECSLSCDEENGPSALLGLRSAICGLCNEGKTESRAHVKSICGKLQTLWKDLDVHHAVFQPLTVTVAGISAVVYSTSLSKDEDVMPTVDTLRQLHLTNPQTSGIALGLGLIVHTLVSHGHQAMADYQRDLAKTWTQDLVLKETNPLEKVSKLTGLLALIGSEQSSLSSKGSSTMTKSDVDTSDVVTTVTKLLTDSGEPGVKNATAWMLGSVYLSACDAGDSRASAPSAYTYLPESSCLRAIVDFLLKAGRFGVESVPPHQVLAAIRCLNVRKPLPPLNWPGILSPFMRMDFGADVKTTALEVAVNQMNSAASASMFLTSWLTPPLFYSLSVETQSSMHRHLPELLRSWSPTVLKTYLDRCCKPAFADQRPRALQLSVLNGLRDALAVKDPPASVTMLMNEVVAELYQYMSEITDRLLLVAFAECLAEVSDDVLDNIIVADFADTTTVIKGSFVRCHLVAMGNQPPSLLNYMIDASFNTDFWCDGYLPGMLSHCLTKFSRHKNGASQAEKQEWLSEFLGHTRSVVTGVMPLAETAPPREKVIHHIITLVTTITLTLTYPAFLGIEFLGIDPDLFSRPSGKECEEEVKDSPQIGADKEIVGHFPERFEHISKLLPSALHVLEDKPWSNLAPKMIDWLTTLVHLPDISHQDKNVLSDALTSMRHCQDFRQASVWSNAFMLPFC